MVSGIWELLILITSPKQILRFTYDPERVQAPPIHTTLRLLATGLKKVLPPSSQSFKFLNKCPF